MLRTKRSPLKSTGDSGNHLDVTNEGLEGFPPAQKKNSSFGGPPTSSGLPVPVTRAVPVIPNENKENADPVFTSASTESDNDDTILEDDEECRDVSTNSDGFNVSEEFQLDDPDQDFKPARLSTSETDDETSPFVVSSLISNRMLFKMDAATSMKLMSGEEGCSPAFDPASKKSSFNSASGSFKFRRCISMVENSGTRQRMILSSPELHKPISSIPDFTSPVSRTGFKRPVPPAGLNSSEDEQSQSKKMRTNNEFLGPVKHSLNPLKHSKSTSVLMSSPSVVTNIMNACSLSDKSNITADGSSKLSLPTIQGHTKNHDLNNIDCHVMAKLLNGDFADKVASFRVIDARYAYEYEGGHIRGAENFGMWDEKAFLGEFFPESLGPIKMPKSAFAKENSSDLRNILIFHCEFSSARGPALLRMLRKKDREVNNDTYPALHYPECYLLHDGYKTFYANYPHLCDPQCYIPMAHPGYISEERKFHKKARTWAAGGGGNTVARTGASSRLLKL